MEDDSEDVNYRKEYQFRRGKTMDTM